MLDQLGGGSSDDGYVSGDSDGEGYGDDIDYVTHDDGNTSVFALDPGMCVEDADLFSGDSFVTVDVVDCALPHYAEVYSSFDIRSGTGYPGDDEIGQQADDGCYDVFAEFVGEAWEQSDYDYNYFTPDSESWGLGDREVLCFVIDYSGGPLRGSAANGEI